MTRIVEVRQKVLKQNDMLARVLREEFAEKGVFVANFVSSPGAGKTTLLEMLLPMLIEKKRVGVLVGDLATENDAKRIAKSGARVQQIETGTICHLDAEMIRKALEKWDLSEFDYLLIENVGNLVCPSSYDLGENVRFVLASCTEGEDKPLKYPTIFNTADAAIVTKVDLAEALETDLAALRANIHSVRPGIPILEVASKKGTGLKELMEFLEKKAAECKKAVASF